MPDERQYSERTFSAGLGKRAAAGYCADCAAPIPLTRIWCEQHRKHGPRPTSPTDTYEAAEARHAAVMVIYIARGTA
jgi:hypothetical protein